MKVEKRLPSGLASRVATSEAAVGSRLEAAHLGAAAAGPNLRELARAAALLLHARYRVRDQATVSVALTFMTPDLGLTGQGSLLFRLGLAVTGIVRSLWSYRDLLLCEMPCSEEQLASLVGSVDGLCVEGKIALMAWMLIVASWVSRRPLPDGADVCLEEGEGAGGLSEEERQTKLLQLMAVATSIMKKSKNTPQQRKQLAKIFKDLKKLTRV
jgi:hypothetical protein